MPTPLYPTFRTRIDDAFEHLIQQQVTPWSFMTAGPPFRIKKFNGKEIAYQGVGFEGSPREVFWSRYIEPFLEHLCVSEIEAAVSMAREKSVDARLLLLELQGLLSSGFRKVYEHMAGIDRSLRGKGYPNSVALRPVEDEIQRMDKFLDERILAKIEVIKLSEERQIPGPSAEDKTEGQSPSRIDIHRYSLAEVAQFLKHLSIGSCSALGALIIAIFSFGVWVSGFLSQSTLAPYEDRATKFQFESEQRNKDITSLKRQNGELLNKLSREDVNGPASSTSRKDSSDVQASTTIAPIQVFSREEKETPLKMLERIRKLHGVRELMDLEDSKEARELPGHVYGFTTYPHFNGFEFNSFKRFPSKDTFIELHLLDPDVLLVGFVTRDEAMHVKDAGKITIFPKPWHRAEDVVLTIPILRIKWASIRQIQTDKKENIDALDIILLPKK